MNRANGENLKPCTLSSN